VNADGKPAPPEVAVERVLKVLDDARIAGGGKEPIGAVVSVDLALVGLRGKPVMLSWSMWQPVGGTRLHGKWLNNNLAYQLQATTERDSTTVDLWVPLPLAAGPYFIRAELGTQASLLAAKDSEPFD
jgi:hypothetical protein